MAKDRIRRKDLKAPDEFVTLTGRALALLREHERSLAAAVAALVAVLLLVGAVRLFQSRQAGNARGAFVRAYQHFAAGELARARDTFDRVRADWPRTLWGRLALLYLGNVQVRLGTPNEATASFEELLRVAEDDGLEQIARYNLGLLRREAGDREAARTYLESAAASPGPLQAAALLALTSTGPQAAATLEGPLAETRDLVPPEIQAYLDSRADGTDG